MTAFRPMRQDEIHHALALMGKEGWAYSEADVRNFLLWEPAGNIVADVEGTPVAYLTSMSYGRFGWIGNVVVREDIRGRAIGRTLVEQASMYLASKGAATTVLNAYVHTVEFYQKLGFKDKARLWVCRGAMHPWDDAGGDCRDEGLRADTLRDVSEIAAMDSEVFGADRSRILARLIDLNPGLGRVIRNSRDDIVGYSLAKRWSGGLEIGPVICQRKMRMEALRAMLDSLVGIAPSENPAFMVVVGRDEPLERLLAGYGLSPGEMMVLMYRGKDPPIRLEDTIAIGALEKG